MLIQWIVQANVEFAKFMYYSIIIIVFVIFTAQNLQVESFFVIFAPDNNII